MRRATWDIDVPKKLTSTVLPAIAAQATSLLTMIRGRLR